MLRQLRPICWNENMPVHAPPLDCSDDCFRYPNCACTFLSKINLSVNRAAVQCLALAVSSRMSASLIAGLGTPRHHDEDRPPTHGYAESRDAAMAAFAKSWGCKH